MLSPVITPVELENDSKNALIVSAIGTLLLFLAIPLMQVIATITVPPPIPIEDSTYYKSPVMPEPEVLKEVPQVTPAVPIFSPAPPIAKPDMKPVDIPDHGMVFDSFANGFPVVGPLAGPTSYDGLVSITDLTRRPHAIQQVMPVYPSALRRARIEGNVLLEFIVSAEGITSQIVAVSATHAEFAQAAIHAARSWVFEPGELDGKRVSTRVRIDVPFRIN